MQHKVFKAIKIV